MTLLRSLLKCFFVFSLLLCCMMLHVVQTNAQQATANNMVSDHTSTKYLLLHTEAKKDQAIWVVQDNKPKAENPTEQEQWKLMTAANHFAYVFLQKNAARIAVELKDGQPITSCEISPRKYHQKAIIENGKAILSFNAAPAQWMLIINGDEDHPLFLFIENDESITRPKKKAAMVVPPGFTDWTSSPPDLSNVEHIYLSEGAMLKASITSMPNRDLTISGAGILINSAERPAITGVAGKGLLHINGITILGDAPTLVEAKCRTNISNVKYFSWKPLGTAMQLHAGGSLNRNFAKVNGAVLMINNGNCSVAETFIYQQPSTTLLAAGADTSICGPIDVQQTLITGNARNIVDSNHYSGSIVSIRNPLVLTSFSSVSIHQLDAEVSVSRIAAIDLQHAPKGTKVELLKMNDWTLPGMAANSFLLAAPGNSIKIRMENVKVNSKLVNHDQFKRQGSVSIGIQ